MNAADTLLDSGFAALLAIAGEPLLFPDYTTVNCVVNRSMDRTVNGVPLETSIEVLASTVTTVPTVAQVIVDGVNKKHTVWRVRRIASNLIMLCHTFSDLPSEGVTIAGSSFTCYVVDSTDGDDLALGGFRNEDAHRLAIDRRIVTNLFVPEEGQLAVFRQTNYSVVRVNRNDSGACLLIDIAARVSSQQT